jgi:hypothetical protein
MEDETRDPEKEAETPDSGGFAAELDVPVTKSGVATILVALVGPRESGKTRMAAILASMLSPKDRMVCAGPVPTLAELMGVPWHRVSRLDRKAADKFFENLEKSDASFFLALDEADSFLGASQFYSQPLQEWVRDNRNFGQGGLFIGHSIGEVAKSYLNNCDLILFFRQSTPGTREWLRKYASDELPSIDELVANLGKYQALVWAPNHTPKCLGIAKADLARRTIRIVPITELREAKLRENPPTDTARSTTTGPARSPDAGTAGSGFPAVDVTPKGAERPVIGTTRTT